MFSTDTPNISAHYIPKPPPHVQYDLLLDIDLGAKAIRSLRELLAANQLTRNPMNFIRPKECDQVAEILTMLRNIVGQLSDKLKSMDRRNALSYGNYHQFLMYLYAANDHSQKLIKLIHRFRSICMETSPERQQIAGDAQKDIWTVIRLCEQLEAESEELANSMLLACP
jgi:hypothetical protein